MRVVSMIFTTHDFETLKERNLFGDYANTLDWLLSDGKFKAILSKNIE